MATSFLIGSSSYLQVKRTSIKSQVKFWSRSAHSLWSYSPLSDEILPLERRNIFPLTYNGENVVRRVAPSLLIESSSNLQVTRTAIKSWMSLNSGQFRVTCPWVPKNAIFDLVWSIAFLVLIGFLWDLQIIWTGIKSRTSSISCQIGLLTLELLALWENVVQRIATLFFIRALSSLQVMKIVIKFWMTLISG